MILVVGSTGSLGMYVVKALTASHKNVVALVRLQIASRSRDLALFNLATASFGLVI